jgi:predicted site-specific integrase-resolvase
VERVSAWAAGEGLAVGRVVTEVGYALDGRRREFSGLLRDPAVTVIVVERRDGFGAGCVEAALSARGRGLLAADPCEVVGGLVRDAAEILASPCSRQRAAGSRAAGSRAARAVAALGQGGPG